MHKLVLTLAEEININPSKEKSKENFCGACGAGLVALLGVGTATSGNVQNNRKMKNTVDAFQKEIEGILPLQEQKSDTLNSGEVVAKVC